MILISQYLYNPFCNPIHVYLTNLGLYESLYLDVISNNLNSYLVKLDAVCILNAFVSKLGIGNNGRVKCIVSMQLT